MKIDKPAFMPMNEPVQKNDQAQPIPIRKGFATREVMTEAKMDESLKKVSELYEKQFLRQMVKAMRGTVTEGGLVPTSQAEKIFREQLDQEHVEVWGDKGGIGLGNMIHKQLRQKYGMDRMEQVPKGPIQIGEKFKIESPTPKKTLVHYELQQAAIKDGNAQVSAPWTGSLVGAKQINPDEYLLEMNHDNGLKSKMVFRGTLDPQFKTATGQEIQAGLRIGLLSPEAKSFFWTVDSL
jgi:flagellar protein FlgJ